MEDQPRNNIKSPVIQDSMPTIKHRELITHMRLRMLYQRLLGITFAFMLLLTSSTQAAESYETQLIESLSNYQRLGDTQVEDILRQYLADFPNSQVAQLMLADLLAARSGIIEPDKSYKGYVNERLAHLQLDGLREEINLRWNQLKEDNPAKQGLVPASILKLDRKHQSVLFVDTKAARLYVFNNILGSLQHVKDYYITIGLKGTHKRVEGDEKTPIGVYHVTSFIPDSELPPLYGTGAFPINYPNVIDKRHKRTGYGIWIHGTHPESINRIPYASNGCVALSNMEFTELGGLIDYNKQTPVVISDNANWVATGVAAKAEATLANTLYAWQSSWESLDVENYLSHYSKTKFKSQGGQNYKKWAAHKHTVSKGKTNIEIGLSDISLFAYPAEENMVVVEFRQNYLSNNFESQADKRQYWRKDAQGKWEIIYEGKQT